MNNVCLRTSTLHLFSIGRERVRWVVTVTTENGGWIQQALHICTSDSSGGCHVAEARGRTDPSEPHTERERESSEGGEELEQQTCR